MQLSYRATLPHVELLYLFSYTSHQPRPTWVEEGIPEMWLGFVGLTDAHTLAILCSMEELSGSVMVALCVQF